MAHDKTRRSRTLVPVARILSTFIAHVTSIAHMAKNGMTANSPKSSASTPAATGRFESRTQSVIALQNVE